MIFRNKSNAKNHDMHEIMVEVNAVRLFETKKNQFRSVIFRVELHVFSADFFFIKSIILLISNPNEPILN